MTLSLTNLAAGSVMTMIVLMSAASLQASPYRPASDAEILERLPARDDDGLQALADRQAELRNDPANLELAVEVARGYAEMGRKKGDPRYEGYARAALSPWWDQDHPPLSVRLLRAHLRQRHHDFKAALDDIDAALLERPGHPQAWLSKAMIHAAEGDPITAAHACHQLPDNVSPLIAAGCKAHAGRLIGKAEGSYRTLEKTLTQHDHAAPALKVWLLTIMAEIAMQLNADDKAEWHLLDAMALDDQDPYLLGIYADLLLDQGRDADVINLLQDHAQIDPLLLRLAIAERRSGQEEAAKHIELLQIRFDASARRQDSIHLREQSRFTLSVLERPEEALELAERNWALQRERADARLFLEAAIASDQREAATPVLDWMTATGIEDLALDNLAAKLKRGQS